MQAGLSNKQFGNRTLNFFNFTNIPTQPWMEKKIMGLFET